MKTKKIIYIVKYLIEKHSICNFACVGVHVCVLIQHVWINTNGDIGTVSSVISFSIKNCL